MSRLLAAILFCLSAVVPAFAEPLDDLFAAARNDDTTRAEEIIAAAETAELRRDMMWMLGGSHQDLRDFTEDWSNAEPDNPVALTARAWSLYREGFLIRGERFRRHTFHSLLDEAQQKFLEALSLAKRATKLDPRFLPAADAVILINRSAGRGEDAVNELERIMALEPNQHSLVLAASALSPVWGGSEEFMQALCTYFAGAVADVPDFDADTCFAQAILRANLWGEKRDWAISIVARKADKPFLEREVLRLAREHAMPYEGIELLTARLSAEGRMSTFVALSWIPDLLKSGELPDKTGFETMLAQDIADASTLADRDPGNLEPLQDLIDLFQIEADFLSFQVLRQADPTEADRAEAARQLEELLQRQAETLDRRTRLLLAHVPRDSAVLQFAVDHIRSTDRDPLEADRWAISALTNAAVYANYQERQVGKIVVEAQKRYAALRERMATGQVPAYSDADLDGVYLCPYVRAVRIVDAICADHESGVESCLLESVMSAPSDSGLEHTLYSDIADRGSCKLEREAPVENLLYDIVELKQLP